jgi:hypothetical protein
MRDRLAVERGLYPPDGFVPELTQDQVLFTTVFKNTKSFFRPVDLTPENIPAETARLA